MNARQIKKFIELQGFIARRVQANDGSMYIPNAPLDFVVFNQQLANIQPTDDDLVWTRLQSVAISGFVTASTFITLNWNNLPAADGGYKVYAYLNYNPTTKILSNPVSNDYANGVAKAAGSTSHMVEGLAAETTYYFVVEAISTTLGNSFSPVGSAATSAVLSSFSQTLINNFDHVLLLNDTSGTTAAAAKGSAGTYSGGFTLQQDGIELSQGFKSVLFNGSTGIMKASIPEQPLEKWAMLIGYRGNPNAGSKCCMSVSHSGNTNAYLDFKTQDANFQKATIRIRKTDGSDARSQMNIDRTLFDNINRFALVYADNSTSQVHVHITGGTTVSMSYASTGADITVNQIAAGALVRGSGASQHNNGHCSHLCFVNGDSIPALSTLVNIVNSADLS